MDNKEQKLKFTRTLILWFKILKKLITKLQATQ